MITRSGSDIDNFWKQCCEATGIDPGEHFEARTFSDPRYSTVTGEIAELARQGKKRGTAHLLMDFEKSQIPRREAGHYLVVLGEQLQPVCVARFTTIDVTPFNRVSEAFAASEGEGDLSLDYWATVHKRYFLKQLAVWGESWSDDLAIVCESFELVWPDP